MRKAKPPVFGKRDPVIYESTKHEIYRVAGKPSMEIRSRHVVRLPLSLALLLFASFVILPDETRALASTAIDYAWEIARNWNFRKGLD